MDTSAWFCDKIITFALSMRAKIYYNIEYNHKLIQCTYITLILRCTFIGFISWKKCDMHKMQHLLIEHIIQRVLLHRYTVRNGSWGKLIINIMCICTDSFFLSIISNFYVTI